MQPFLDRPQCLFALRSLDQDQPGWIESERVETVAMKPAGSVAVSRGDPNQRAGFWQTAENGGDEAESGCGCAFCFGHNFMQSAAGETTLRQVGVDSGNAKR
jgi:hypothetical protein